MMLTGLSFIYILGIHIVQMTSLRERPRLPSYFPSILSTFPCNRCILGTRPVLPCTNGSCCKLEFVGTKSVFLMLLSLFVCRRLLTGGTVIPVSLIAVVPTVLEKSVFYGYPAVASVSLGLPTVCSLLFSSN